MNPHQELVRALKTRYEDFPAALAAVSQKTGMLLYRNRVCRTLLPGMRSGARARRYLGEEPSVDKLLLISLFSESFFVSCDTVHVGDEALFLLLFQRENTLLATETAKALHVYNEHLFSLTHQVTSDSSESDKRARGAYVSALSKNLAALSECNRYLYGILSEMRRIKPGRVFACSAAELLSCVYKQLSALRPTYGVCLETDCPPGVTILVNFRDFVFALLNILSFSFVFANAKTVGISVTPHEGYALFEFRVPDPFSVLRLYRGFLRETLAASESIALERAGKLFYPLAAAMQTLGTYGHEARLVQEDKLLRILVRVATTLELPELVVRAGSDDLTVYEICRLALPPESYIAELCSIAAELSALPLVSNALPMPKKAKLF